MQSCYWSPVISIGLCLIVGACENAAPHSPVADASVPAAHGGESSGQDLLPDSGPQRAAASPKDAGPALPSMAAAKDAAVSGDAAADKCAKFVEPADCKIPDGRWLPSELRCTGLYGNWEKRQPACGVTAYAPAYEAWSDGAKPQRWFSLPEGGSVDAAKPEAFAYPLGTQFWQELRIDVKGQERLAETRLLRKTDKGWLYASYVWDDKAEHATQNNDGVKGLFGTDYEVPPLDQCQQCHSGREDFVLGWDPILLGPGAKGLEYEKLISSGVLQNIKGPAPKIPGDAPHDAPALAYLHVNCGVSCHNPQGAAKDSGLFTRLDIDKLGDLKTTPTFATGLWKAPSANAKVKELMPPADMPFSDIYLSRPDASLLLVRMQVRGSEAQMPPIATRRVDDDGVKLIQKLVE